MQTCQIDFCLFFQGLFQDVQSPFLHGLILWMTYHILVTLNVNLSQWKLFCFCVFLGLKFSSKFLDWLYF